MIALLVITAAATAALIWINNIQVNNPVARIYRNGELIREVALDVGTDLDLDLGSNNVSIRDGKIAVSRADCPDKLCIKRGFAGASNSYPIICLPNRLEIRIVESNAAIDVDGITG